MPPSKKSKPSEKKNKTSPTIETLGGGGGEALEASIETARESKEPGDLPTQQHQMRPQSTTPKLEKTTTTTTSTHAHAHTDNSFEDFYLQQITKEFADDIDKIRQAGDFKESSLPVLVAALKQGATIYTEEERRDYIIGKDIATTK